MSSLTKQDYIDYIKLQLTGGVLELEIEDEIISKFIDQALIELRRYYSGHLYVTVPYAKAIDLTDFKHIAVTDVFRAQGIISTGDSSMSDYSSSMDPLYVQQWAAFSGGGLTYNLQNYITNFSAYSTLLQMQNTLSTDMSFIEDKKANKLYINCGSNIPSQVTIEYIPILTQVEQVDEDYWIDILRRLSLAMVKIALGRIRTRFTQSNALWTQDGDSLLSEGNEELNTLRENLRVQDYLFLPRD